MSSQSTPSMSEAQFLILNTKLDGLSLLIEEKLTNLEEKVDHDRRTREIANDRIESKIDAHDARITALEHERTKSGAYFAVWVTLASFAGGCVMWAADNITNFIDLFRAMSG